MQKRRIDNARRVWMAVTAAPHASHRELMARLDLSYGAVQSALDLLKDQGYISFIPDKSRAIAVCVPFVAQESR